MAHPPLATGSRTAYRTRARRPPSAGRSAAFRRCAARAPWRPAA